MSSVHQRLSCPCLSDAARSAARRLEERQVASGSPAASVEGCLWSRGICIIMKVSPCAMEQVLLLFWHDRLTGHKFVRFRDGIGEPPRA